MTLQEKYFELSRIRMYHILEFPCHTHERVCVYAQLCPILRDPMDCSLPGSSVHGIFQARILQ